MKGMVIITMKKLIAVLLTLTLLCAFAGCGEKTDINAKSEGVLTYAHYTDAALDTQVVVEGFIQAKQAYSEEYGNTSLYLQDGDGAYFVYRIACTAEQYESMKVGSKIKVTGYKSEWSGEVEIVDATFEMEEGTYTATAVDVTSLLGTDGLAAKQNQKVLFKGLKVEAANEAGDAFLYSYDGSGQEGSDLYFNVSLNGTTYSFVVESDLCGADTDVYKAVKALKVGDTIDVEGFLYWYNGANPHVTSVTVSK